MLEHIGHHPELLEVGKFGWYTMKNAYHEYVCRRGKLDKRLVMKRQFPDCRLDINGHLR